MRFLSISLMLCLFLVACEGRGANAESALQEKCNILNEESEEIYQVVSGVVKVVRIGPSTPVECVGSNREVCSYVPVYAEMSPMIITESKPESFSVYTSRQPLSVIKENSLYFQEEKEYIFCARKADDEIIKLHKQNVFHIDDLSLIQLVE